MEILVFEVAGQRLGIRADTVREIVRAVTITPLPNAPAIVEGVINVRGTVVVVLDLRGRFGWPPRPLDPSNHFVLARAAHREVALRVDRATDLVTCDPAAVDRAEDVLVRSRYVAGVAKLADGLVLIHDLATFLSASEAAEVDVAIAAGQDAGAGT